MQIIIEVEIDDSDIVPAEAVGMPDDDIVRLLMEDVPMFMDGATWIVVRPP